MWSVEGLPTKSDLCRQHTAFAPVGYQTNQMVYGPGGCKFTDFARVGAPVQLILAIVTTVGIVFS